MNYLCIIKSSKISDYVDKSDSIKIKKHGIKKLKDHLAKNASFMTPENIRWFNYVLMNWLPPKVGPFVFLPCGCANKTRSEKDPRKFFSQGMSHQFTSKNTRNENYSRIILSEPLTIIPYSLESHELRLDYNLPPPTIFQFNPNLFSCANLPLFFPKFRPISQKEKIFIT
nr:hypothetical protein [Candidatus Prometheoarchaeum syntrophicum]